MKDSEAKELLAKSMQTTVVGLEDSPDLDILIEELHSLPLALSQAGAFMRRTNTPISEYYAMMQQRMERWDLLTASQLDPHRRRNLPNSILQTWGISMERVRKECLTAYRIIHVVAYVENQNIPFKVMLAASGTDNVVEVKSALARLRDFSFVGFQNEDGERNYEMHKLVQEASRFGLNVAKHDAQWFVDQISATEPYVVSLAFEVADRTFPTSNPSTWGECGLYLPHALQAFEWALLVGDDDVHIEAAKSALSDRIMHFFHERGRWVERERLSNQMLDLRSRILGEKHPGTLQSMEDLEVTLIRMRRFEEAQGIAERELDLRIKVLGERDARTLRSMANLATTWNAQGRYDESEKAFDKVWQVRREVLGVKHQETIRAMLDLGTVYRLQGHLKESESLTTQGLMEWTEVMGKDHPDPIYAKFMLAQVWHDMDRKQDSFTLANECLGLQCRVLGKEHPMTLKQQDGSRKRRPEIGICEFQAGFTCDTWI